MIAGAYVGGVGVMKSLEKSKSKLRSSGGYLAIGIVAMLAGKFLFSSKIGE